MAEEAILGFLQNNEEITDSGQFSTEHNLDHNEIVNVIKSLHGFRYIDVQAIKRETWILTKQGREYATQGSPEVELFLAVPEEGTISEDELKNKLEDSIIGNGAVKNKWIEIRRVSRKVQHVEEDKVKMMLLQIQQGKVRKQFKDIFVQMLLEFRCVVPTSTTPFFLKAPSTTRTLPEDYVEKVKRVHEIGGYESRGYNYVWKREEANKNLLPTHTTAVSSRMLYALAQEQSFSPNKYFSIDRVFRNEAVDPTHLADNFGVND